MKKLFFIVFLLAGMVCNAQNRVDYENVIARFVKCYNTGQVEKMCELWQLYSDNPEQCHWDKNFNNKMLESQGEILSYKYMLVSDETLYKGVTLFKIVTTKKAIVLGVTLNKNNKFIQYEWNIPTAYKWTSYFKD